MRKYAQAVDRESAREILAEKADAETAGAPPSRPSRERVEAKTAPSTFERILKSPLTRSVATQITRTVMGALLGPTRRRRY